VAETKPGKGDEVVVKTAKHACCWKLGGRVGVLRGKAIGRKGAGEKPDEKAAINDLIDQEPCTRS